MYEKDLEFVINGGPRPDALVMSALPAEAEFEPYDPPVFTITKTVSPSDASPACYIDGPDAWPAGETVGFTAIAGPGWTFDHWEGEIWDTNATTYFIMPPNDIGVFAVFVPTPVVQYYLYVSANNGYVSVNGTVTQSGDMLGPYNAGTIVNLSATPDTGYYFKDWSGAASGVSPTTTVVMDAEKYVFANFEPIPPAQYTIHKQISPAEAGSTCYIMGPNWQYSDSPVTLEAVAGTGWVFERWTGDYTSATSTINFNMPPTDVYLTAEFSSSITTYPLTVVTSPTGIASTTGSGNYEAGTSVNISAPQYITFNSGMSRYSFTGWSGSGITFASPSSPSTSMTMPAGAATVTANYVTQHQLTVNNGGHGTAGGAGWYNAGANAQATISPLIVAGTAGTRYNFAGWSGDATGSSSPSNNILMNGPKTATATWTTQYYLTVNNGGHGSAGGAGWYNAGVNAQATISPLTLAGTAGTRYVFAGWIGDAEGSGSPSSNILMNGPKTATATWTTQYYLTVINGGHGTAGGEGWYNAGDYTQATISSLTVAGTAGTQYIFAGWEGDAIGSGSPSQYILMNGPKTAAATWTTQYYLTVDNGGHGTVWDDGWYDADTLAQAKISSLVVDGTSGTRYIFAGWSGDASGSGSPSNDILMDRPKTATATWTTQYYLNVDNGGHGTAGGAGWYNAGVNAQATMIPLTVAGTEGTQYVFAGWSGDASGSGSPSNNIMMDEPKTATATWTTQYFLTVDNGGHGTAGGEGWYDAGDNAQATISPLTVAGTEGTQYVFAGWSGDASGSGSPSDNIVIDEPKTATATWTTQYLVTFAQSGLGSDADATVVTGSITSPAQSVSLADNFSDTSYWADAGSTLTYGFATPVASSTVNKQYALTTPPPSPASPITVGGPLTVTGTYKTQWKITFDQNGIGGDTTSTVVTVSGAGKTAAALPFTTDWIDDGTTVTYGFASPVSGNPGTKYVWAVTSGLGQTGQSGSISVTEAGTVTGNYWKLTVSVTPASQQYSDPVSFAATLTPGSYPGTSSPASVDFYINDLNMGTGTPATADGVTTWTLNDIPLLGSSLENMAAGSKTVTARFSGIDSTGYPAVPLTVTKENCSMEFTVNPVSVKVFEDGGSSSEFTLEVTIEQAGDGYPGHLSNITASNIALSFKPVGIGGNNLNLTATSFNSGTGIATFSIPQGALGVETYSVEVALNNNWFASPGAEDVLCVYDPSLGFTTGGGWFYWPQDGSELAGAKTNFGYTMKYNKKGTNIQGSLLMIAHLENEDIYRIKSNALYGLALNQETGIATFSGKCTYTYPVPGSDPVTLGNQEFMIYVKDNNEPGSGIDQLWFTLLGQSFTLDANGNKQADTAEIREISGGNIVVPHIAQDDGEGDKVPPAQGKKK
jgi:uncharacterized repeat protein (TIGR02543 family)